jgi:hypothetical protein
MKNTEKSITWVTDDEWSGTLNNDLYSYDGIIDNL